MKTEIVDVIANEKIYEIQYFKNLYIAHKGINKYFLVFFSAIFLNLIAIHV